MKKYILGFCIALSLLVNIVGLCGYALFYDEYRRQLYGVVQNVESKVNSMNNHENLRWQMMAALEREYEEMKRDIEEIRSLLPNQDIP